MIIGFILILVAILLIYLQIKNKIFYKNEHREDFYIPPEVRGFWGIILMMLIGGIILILQNF